MYHHARIQVKKDQHDIRFPAMLIRTKSSWISNTLNTSNHENKSYNNKSLIVLNEVGYMDHTISFGLVKKPHIHRYSHQSYHGKFNSFLSIMSLAEEILEIVRVQNLFIFWFIAILQHFWQRTNNSIRSWVDKDWNGDPGFFLQPLYALCFCIFHCSLSVAHPQYWYQCSLNRRNKDPTIIINASYIKPSNIIL